MNRTLLPVSSLLGSTLLLGVGLALTGCGGGSNGGSSSSPTSPPNGNNIGAAGGKITLANIAEVTFPANAFSANQTVSLSTVTDADTATTFNITAPLYDAGQALAYTVKVISSAAPTKDVVFRLSVPASFAASVPAKQNLEAFVQIFETQGLSILDNFQLLSSTYDASAKTVTVTVPATAFTSMRRSDNKFETLVTLAPTPGTSSGAAQAPASGTCQGSSIGSPLKSSLQVASGFNPPKHYGADLKVNAAGETVVPVADGVVQVVGFDERPLAKADPRSGKKIKGWGRYVIIKHTDGSHTLYAHLVKDSTKNLVAGKTTVTKGQTVLGTTDNTGGSSGPHLHLEYAPNGSIFNKKNKIDPVPCIGTNVNSSIVVGDNGPIADDAFQVFLDGLSLGTTTIGGTNTLGASNLRVGNHELKIVAVIAPDDAGTLGVTLKDGLIFSTGDTTRSANLDLNGSVTYTIVVPTTPSATRASQRSSSALPPVSPSSPEARAAS